MDSLDDVKVAVWLLVPITLFYVFIGSLFWKLSFKIIHPKTKIKGGFIYFLSGAVYGVITISIVTFTIAKTDILGWLAVIFMMAVAAYIFYAIQKILV